LRPPMMGQALREFHASRVPFSRRPIRREAPAALTAAAANAGGCGWASLALVDQKKSGGTGASQAASDSEEQTLGRFVAGHAQDRDPVRAHHPTGPMKQLEAQRMNTLQNMKRGALGGAVAPWRSGLDLDVGDQVVRQGHELLPGAVGSVVARRDGAEGEPALEFAERLLVSAAAAHEMPQLAAAQVEVGRDRGVLVV